MDILLRAARAARDRGVPEGAAVYLDITARWQLAAELADDRPQPGSQ